MDIIEQQGEHGYCLKITRSLDRTNSGDLDKAFAGLFDQWDGAVWVDVSELQSIDSSGLALLLKWHRAAFRVGRLFGLVHTNSYHRKLLEITRLDEDLQIYDEPGGPKVSILRGGRWSRTPGQHEEIP